MSNLNALNLRQLFQRIANICLSTALAFGILSSYSNVAQAATDTTSAATRGDANRINQRKEDASHYPNWYDDQRSLESYMEDAGVGPGNRGDSPTDQNNDAGYNPIRQDRVNGYHSDEQQDVSLVDRTRTRLKDAADNVRDTLNPNSRSKGNDRYERTRTSANEVKGRTGNRLERAKETFQGATERTATGSNPIITGESNR